MRPSMCRILDYAITAEEAQDITERRRKRPSGHQSDAGDPVTTGDRFPLVVVRVDGEAVSGQLLLNGNDQTWVAGKREGTETGTWQWPGRV